MKKLNYFAISLPEGLKCKTKYSEGIKDMIGASFGNNILFRVAPIEQRDYPVPISHIIPILRPLSDLTKPITQANYNGGEPFVPIDEINKLFNFTDAKLVYYENCGLGWKIEGGFVSTAITTDMMIKPIQLLFKWHFDLITEDCEKILTTSEFNPYK